MQFKTQITNWNQTEYTGIIQRDIMTPAARQPIVFIKHHHIILDHLAVVGCDTSSVIRILRSSVHLRTASAPVGLTAAANFY